jgi:PAS domain S-box-containing protein
VLVFHDVTAKCRAQAALSETHERAAWLARFPEQNPNPVIRASADGTVLYCNPVSARLRGWTCEVGQLLQNELLPLVDRAIAEGKEVQQDVELGERSYIVWVVPFPEERYANIYSRDITERKRAEAALRENDWRLNRAQEIAHLGSWELDLVNNRLTWSDEVYRIFGLRPQEFGATYEAFLEAVHPDDRAAVDAAYSGSVREGRDTYEIEHRVVRKSTGEIRTVHERCEHIRDASGRIIRSVGMVHDITERKQAEEALVRAKEDWERTFASVPDLIAIIDNQHRVLRVNAAMAQRIGVKAEECIGLRCYEVVHGLSEPPEFCPHSRTLKDGRQHIEEVHEDRLGGDFVVSTTPLHDDQGEMIGSVHVAHDITQRKRAEEALRQRTLELQQLTETLEQQVQERTEELEVANEALRNEIDECQAVEIELKKSQSDLRHLSVEILNAQEKERKMVAQEIHDSIGSSLAAIKFKVETTLTEVSGSPKTTTAMTSLIPIVQGAIDETRRIQMNLRPSILDDLGILATIRWFCRQFESTYSDIRIRQSIKIEEHEVPDSLKTVIFRVLQEGLNNVAKHSKAKVVLLFLRKTGHVIKLVIRDYGQGFDLSKVQSPDGPTHGLGLKSMRERTELSGGSFAIESREGKGTIMRASWPL